MEEFLVTLFLLPLFTGVSSITTISTVPTDTTLATSFNNLIVTVQFPTPTAFGDTCVWFYGGELDSGTGAQFYSDLLGGCDPPAPGTYDSITCTEQTIDGTSHVVTTLTITQPLVAGNLNIEVRCTTATTPGPITRTVQDCSLDETTYTSLAFTCNDAPCEYNSAGTLSCKEGFSSSGASSSSTTCQADATLTNLDVLTCAAITCQGSDAEEPGANVCLVSSSDSSTNFTYNATTSVQCCEGFEGSGPVDRICDGNTTTGWTSVDLGCTAITCQGSDAEEPGAGLCLVNSTDSSTNYSYNDNISVQCCEGFEGSGSAEKTCGASGWSLVPLSCTAITCLGSDATQPDIVCLDNEADSIKTFNYNETIFVKCCPIAGNDIYEQAENITCTGSTSSGWSQSSLPCEQITCNGSDAENRTNGVCLANTTPTTYQYGDTISVQCCSNDSVTADITCDGNSTSGWSSISLGCTPVTCNGSDVLIFDITCPVNESDANKEFSYGDTTQVKCCSGGGGFATKTCDISSSSSASGMWDLPDLPSNVRTLNGGDYAIIVIFSVLTVLSFSVVPLYQFYDWQFLGNKWVRTGAVIVATGSGLGLIIGYTSVSQSICNCENGNVSIALSEGGAIAIGVCLSLLVVVVAGVEFYFVFSKANKPKLGGNVTEHDASLHAEHEESVKTSSKNQITPHTDQPPNRGPKGGKHVTKENGKRNSETEAL